MKNSYVPVIVLGTSNKVVKNKNKDKDKMTTLMKLRFQAGNTQIYKQNVYRMVISAIQKNKGGEPHCEWSLTGMKDALGHMSCYNENHNRTLTLLPMMIRRSERCCLIWNTWDWLLGSLWFFWWWFCFSKYLGDIFKINFRLKVLSLFWNLC